MRAHRAKKPVPVGKREAIIAPRPPMGRTAEYHPLGTSRKLEPVKLVYGTGACPQKLRRSSIWSRVGWVASGGLSKVPICFADQGYNWRRTSIAVWTSMSAARVPLGARNCARTRIQGLMKVPPSSPQDLTSPIPYLKGASWMLDDDVADCNEFPQLIYQLLPALAFQEIAEYLTTESEPG